MSVFDHPDFDKHELVAFRHDPVSGLNAIIAVHNTTVGWAIGGCRMYNYASTDEALSDVLRLSRGMTYKSALAGIPVGGGKSVIIGNPARDKNRDVLLAMGDFVDSLGGQYTAAEDSGTSVRDVKVMGERTDYVSGVMDDEEHGGDPSPVTAYGVFQGIRTSVHHKLQSEMEGIRVALQGVGSVGYHLANLLVESGAHVFVTDVNVQNMQRVVSNIDVTPLAVDQLFSADVDVIAPCAMGGAINAKTVDQIKASIVAGAANNQLASPEFADVLNEKGVLYAPDYVINSGGIIDAYYQTQGIREQNTISRHVDAIGDILTSIYQRADQESKSTLNIADEMAEEILANALANAMDKADKTA